MGQRANLFEEARNIVSILKSKAASKHTYERNFPMSIIRITRRHLWSVSHELINAFEKNLYEDIPALMKRYYKLNQLHISQLTRYLKICNEIETKILEHNKMYLLQLSQMFSQLLKGMRMNSKKECLSLCRTDEQQKKSIQQQNGSPVWLP